MSEARLLTIERVALLRKLELLSGTPGHVLAAVAAACEEAVFGPGDVVMRRGEEGDSLFVIVTGHIRIGIGDRHVRDLGPGAVLGELAVLVHEPRSATATAIDDCLLLRLHRTVFDELLLDHPEVARGVINSLVRRFQSPDADVGPPSATS